MLTDVRLRDLSLGTSQRSGAPDTRRGHIQTMSEWLSRQPLNHSPLFLHYKRPFPLPETCSFTFVASSSFSSIKNGGLQLLVDSGCPSRMDDPEMIPNADQNLGEYSELHPPKRVYGPGSHELLATGTANLTIGVEKLQAYNEHVCYVSTWSWSQFAVFVSSASKRGRDDNILSLIHI